MKTYAVMLRQGVLECGYLCLVQIFAHDTDNRGKPVFFFKELIALKNIIKYGTILYVFMVDSSEKLYSVLYSVALVEHRLGMIIFLVA